MGWWILGGIVLFFALLFLAPIRVHLLAKTEGVAVQVTVLRIPVYRLDTSQKEQKKHKKRKKKKQDAASQKKKKRKKKPKPEKSKEKKSLSETLSMVSDLLGGVKKGLRRLTRGIHIRHLTLAIRVGDLDASKCAVAYGRMNAIVYPLLAVLDLVFPVQYDTVTVQCGFGTEKTRYLIECTIRTCIWAFLAAGAAFGASYLCQQLEKRKSTKTKKRG